MRRWSRTRRGFTLIELMVAIVVASVVTVALYSLFTAQSRQLLYQDLQMEMHQNLRFGTAMLARSIRSAGYLSGGYVTGVFGSSPGGSADDKLPVIMSWDADGDNGSDAITVVYGDPSLTMDTRADVTEDCTTDQLSFRPKVLDYATKLPQYESGDLLLCMDYGDFGGIESYLWSISADADASTGVISVTSNTGTSDYDSVCASGDNLAPVLTCSKGQVLTFYIDDDDTDGVGPGSSDHPVLMMDMDFDWPEADDVPLVDHIEDVQFEYCVDDGTDSADCSDSSWWVDSISTTEADKVWMVRITLVARSSREDPSGLYTSKRPAIANNSAGSSSDHYYREVLSTEVTVRNMRYQADVY